MTSGRIGSQSNRRERRLGDIGRVSVHPVSFQKIKDGDHSIPIPLVLVHGLLLILLLTCLELISLLIALGPALSKMHFVQELFRNRLFTLRECIAHDENLVIPASLFPAFGMELTLSGTTSRTLAP
jgi:hypothetical protein